VVDTREQRPDRFARIRQRVDKQDVPFAVPTITATLATADYSIHGHEQAIVIERKASLDELCTCVGSDRQRFEAELKRMAAIPSAHVVLEFTFGDIFEAPATSKISRRAVAGSLLAWSHRFGVRVWFAGNRSAAEWLTYHLLHRWYDDHTRRESGEVLGAGAAVTREHERRIRQHERRCYDLAEHSRGELLPVELVAPIGG
jgi:ERCC4-type nuclease